MPHDAKGGRAATLKIGVEELLGFMGFATLVLALCGLFLVIPRAATGEGEALRVQLLASVALIVGFAAAHGLAHRLATHRCRTLLVAACLGLAAFGAACLVPLAADAALIPCACVAAIGVGALACLWFGFLCLQQPKMVCFYVSTGVFAGMTGALLIEYLHEVVAGVLLVTAFALSVGSYVGILRLKDRKPLPDPVDNAESDKRSSISWQSMIMLAFVYFEAGLLFHVTLALDLVPFACLGAMAASLALAVDAVRSRVITERSMLAPMVPMTLGALLLMFSYGPAVQRVAVALLAAIATVFIVFGWTALAGHVRIFKLSALRVFAKARMADYVAVAAGLGFGYLAVSLDRANPLDALRLCIVLSLVYAIIASFCRKPRFPDPSLENEEGATPATGGNSLWRRRCRALSDQYDLSERQHEVLVLIAQGRNAKYIQEALTISLSTAQTHIRNIYRKVGVHSRQELLSLIESTKLYGED